MGPNGVYSVETGRTFWEACKRVQEKAGLEGFRVLHLFDLQAALQEKGLESGPTVIVEMCNAALASEALRTDPGAALLLPCKVVVQEIGRRVVLSTLLPESLVEGGDLKTLAQKVGVKLMSLIDTAASVPSCCRI